MIMQIESTKTQSERCNRLMDRLEHAIFPLRKTISLIRPHSHMQPIPTAKMTPRLSHRQFTDIVVEIQGYVPTHNMPAFYSMISLYVHEDCLETSGRECADHAVNTPETCPPA
jgi:hypothetical protein